MASANREAKEGPILLADDTPDPMYVGAYYASLEERK